MSLLRMVQLDWLSDRLPSQLSGGQRQRVALARALAVEPRVLLLDEPFGSLDAKVRQELRRWLRRLHDEIRLTSVFVTHDQEEALEVADRVVVMNQGRVEQIGSPEEIFERPATPFVIRFMGNVNVFHGRVQNGKAHLGPLALDYPEHPHAEERAAAGFTRPYDLDVERTDGGRGRLLGHAAPRDAGRARSCASSSRATTGRCCRSRSRATATRPSARSSASGSTCGPRQVRVFLDARARRAPEARTRPRAALRVEGGGPPRLRSRGAAGGGAMPSRAVDELHEAAGLRRGAPRRLRHALRGALLPAPHRLPGRDRRDRCCSSSPSRSSAGLHFLISAVLWWNTLAAGREPVRARLQPLGRAARAGGRRSSPRPGPRRFAQGMAAAFNLGAGLALLSGQTPLAWVLQAMLVVAFSALLFGRFCLGAYVYHLLKGRVAFANSTLPWARG